MQNALVSSFQAILSHIQQLKIVSDTLCIVEALVKQTWWYIYINSSFPPPPHPPLHDLQEDPDNQHIHNGAA